MKFRWRGGATGFVSRRIGKGIARSVPDDQLGSCLLIAFILAVLSGSPILILALVGIAIAILPLIILLAFLVGVGIIAYYAIKNHYPQMFLSWFFLKEGEADGTVLSFGEIKSRIKEFADSFNIPTPP